MVMLGAVWEMGLLPLPLLAMEKATEVCFQDKPEMVNAPLRAFSVGRDWVNRQNHLPFSQSKEQG